MGETIVGEIVTILVSGIQNLASGIAQGLNSMAQGLFVTGTGTSSDPYQLSTFGAIVAVFGGIALAIGLTTLVTKWIMSLGARN